MTAMRFFKVFVLCIGTLASVATLAMAAPGVTIKIGSLVPVSSPWGKVITQAIRKIKKDTGGAVEVQFFHTGRLGSESDMLSQLLIGQLDAAGLTSAAVSNLEKGFMILEFPYLFRDYDEAHHVMDEAVTPELEKRLAAKQLRTVDLMENGFMQMITTGPIQGMEDFKKMKIGSWESPVQLAYWRALGANPKPVAVTEVASLYATGVVDAGANSYSAAAAYDFVFGGTLDRSTITITHTDHIFQAGVLLFSEASINRVPAEHRKVMLSVLKRMAREMRKQVPPDEAKAKKKLKKLKYQVVEPGPELQAALKNAGEKTRRDLAPEVGEGFFQAVMKARQAYREARK